MFIINKSRGKHNFHITQKQLHSKKLFPTIFNSHKTFLHKNWRHMECPLEFIIFNILIHKVKDGFLYNHTEINKVHVRYGIVRGKFYVWRQCLNWKNCRIFFKFLLSFKVYFLRLVTLWHLQKLLWQQLINNQKKWVTEDGSLAHLIVAQLPALQEISIKLVIFESSLILEIELENCNCNN